MVPTWDMENIANHITCILLFTRKYHVDFALYFHVGPIPLNENVIKMNT